LWRGNGDDRVYWTSCNAGQNTLGIEADGTIKGCPSLPTTPYAGGKIRELSLENIWLKTDELAINRTRTNQDLWGFCASCYYASRCKAGCTWTTHVLFGRAGNNPFCHHRALQLAKQGLRERIAQVEGAPGIPFDHGRFELILESSADSSVGAIPLSGNTLVQISRTQERKGTKTPQQIPAEESDNLILCRGCRQYVLPDTQICPFCDGDIRALAKRHEARLREARKAYARLAKLLQPSSSANM
jgi:radical SAM protein with 4Fe4S-binding SPASM domain